MINIIKHICESVYNSNLNWDEYLYLGKKDKKGRVFGKSDPSMRDYDYIGLTDKRGNYFYIRHKDDEQIGYTEAQRFGSCINPVQATAQCRLVAVIKNYPDKYNLNKNLVNELSNVDFQSYVGDELKIRVEVTASMLNPFTVISEESNGKEKPFDHSLTIMYVDFNLIWIEELNNCQNLNCGSEHYHLGGSNE
jgi:hypothetical protein